MNYDITFCSKKDCNNLECKRNQRNLPEIDNLRIIWQSDFVECEHWKE